MSDNDNREILQRVRRIETRQMTMGNALGVDMREERRITIDVANAHVHIEAMDVTFSGVTNRARREGLGGRTITVYYKGEMVASLPLKP